MGPSCLQSNVIPPFKLINMPTITALHLGSDMDSCDYHVTSPYMEVSHDIIGKLCLVWNERYIITRYERVIWRRFLAYIWRYVIFKSIIFFCNAGFVIFVKYILKKRSIRGAFTLYPCIFVEIMELSQYTCMLSLWYQYNPKMVPYWQNSY